MESIIEANVLKVIEHEAVIDEFKSIKKPELKRRHKEGYYSFNEIRIITSKLIGLKSYIKRGPLRRPCIDILAHKLGMIDNVCHATNPKVYYLMLKKDFIPLRRISKKTNFNHYVLTQNGIIKYIEFANSIVREYNDIYGSRTITPLDDPRDQSQVSSMTWFEIMDPNVKMDEKKGTHENMDLINEILSKDLIPVSIHPYLID